MGKMITIMTRPCMVCKETSRVEVDEDKFRRWHEGELIQRVWPGKTDNERELIMTGTHGQCWNAMFKDTEGVEGEDDDAEG